MLAIVKNDLRNNRVTLAVLLLTIPVTAALGVYGVLSPMRALTVMLGFGAFLGPIMSPSWLVGMDKMKGPMELLASLPIPRDRIVLAKLLGCALISVTLLTVAAVASFVAHFIDFATAVQFLALGSVAVFLACTISNAVYFLFPMRVATLAVTACIAVVTPFMHPLMTTIHSLGASVIAPAFVAALAVGVGAVIVSKGVSAIWSRRSSPCE